MNATTHRDVVRATYDAVGRGDIPAVLDLLADDVEWTLQGPSAVPIAGTRHGKEGVAEFFSLVGQTLDFQQFEPRTFVTEGDTVVVLGYERSVIRATGKTFDQEWAHVYTLRDGAIVTFRAFEDTGSLLAALDSD